MVKLKHFKVMPHCEMYEMYVGGGGRAETGKLVNLVVTGLLYQMENLYQ